MLAGYSAAAKSTSLAHLDRPSSAQFLDVNTWSDYALHPAESFSCLAQRWDANRTVVAEINHVVNPQALLPGQNLMLPSGPSGWTVLTAHKNETRLELAARNNVPLWRMMRYNPLPFYTGATVVLPLEGPEYCLPYPLEELEVLPTTVTRGDTTLLVMRTAEPATCEITFLGRTEPCYAGDDSRLYAMLGLSALMDPGQYDLVVRLQADEVETVFTLPLEVTAGWYGFQWINPPSQLYGLMDAALMEGELAYLETWRAIRTPERQWSFPLSFPLPRTMSISADYGDRRSYGGLVNGYHSGIDYRAWTGLPVLAPADGTVLMAEHLDARGNAILVDHGWGLVTGYWHLSRIDVEVGQHVSRSEQIGLVGNTGLSTGSHLHWEVWVNGVSVDGKQWLKDPELLGSLFKPQEARTEDITTNTQVQ